MTTPFLYVGILLLAFTHSVIYAAGRLHGRREGRQDDRRHDQLAYSEGHAKGTAATFSMAVDVVKAALTTLGQLNEERTLRLPRQPYPPPTPYGSNRHSTRYPDRPDPAPAVVVAVGRVPAGSAPGHALTDDGGAAAVTATAQTR